MILAAQPTDVYLDSDLVVNAVVEGLANHEACLQACARLKSAQRQVYFSQILRIEYYQAFRGLATKNQLPGPIYEEFSLDQWSQRDVRRRWMEHGRKQLGLFLRWLPSPTELPLDASVIDHSVTVMARYALRSLDAVHITTALHYEIPVFWTCDDHFLRVDDLAVDIIRDPV